MYRYFIALIIRRCIIHSISSCLTKQQLRAHIYVFQCNNSLTLIPTIFCNIQAFNLKKNYVQMRFKIDHYCCNFDNHKLFYFI